MQYPPVAAENGIEGTVVVGFVVERDGSISNVNVLRSPDPSLSKEAVRVVKSMPKWNPGMQNGSPVRVKYNVPVKFKLQQ
jgi:protein TonB